jgi:hypothetical protein
VERGGQTHGDYNGLKPFIVDLFCGLGGWAEGFLAEGFDVVGFDIKRHDYGTGGYPGQLVIQDVLTLHGKQFKDAAGIVASPPCQAYSYRAMPWKRAKALPPPDNTLFEICFRIQREASEAAGRHIPLIVENVRGAEKWVGQSQANFGSFYLWGDVGMVGNRVIVLNGVLDIGVRAKRARKINGPRRNRHLAPKEFGWHKTVMADGSSKSEKRKAASAMIAKIPFPLANYIARQWATKPAQP